MTDCAEAILTSPNSAGRGEHRGRRERRRGRRRGWWEARVETKAEAELHLGGAVRGEREGEAEVDGGDDGLQRREATNGGRPDGNGGGGCTAAASQPSCYALRSIHAVHVFPFSHHVFYSNANCQVSIASSLDFLIEL